MGAFYGNKIKNGVLTIEEVPALWKTLTENWLKENE